MNRMTSRRTRLTYRVLSAFIAFTFSFTSVIPPSCAQGIASLNLPAPGVMVTPSAAFVPVLLKGMTIHPDNPLKFDFIIDSGNTNFKEDQIKNESQRLVKYFLASMTIPKDDLWVNLSPYEKDRIIPEELGKTELGRDMLAQDYILKQLTASLMYPEKELGKEFWDKVYQKAKEKFGTTEIPVDTFNKVWILPETATVYEHEQTVYIVEAKLRVMLDSDYQAMNANVGNRHAYSLQGDDAGTGRDLSLQTDIIRKIILPEIEREVNYGQNFAPLRQIYHSLILAKWYKETIKNSLLSKIYVDQKKIAGINIDDATLKDQIYAQYMEAYKKGVFNYIKEDYDRLSNEVIPRKYFSGGIKGDVAINRSGNLANIKEPTGAFRLSMRIDPQKKGKSSSPILGGPWTLNGARKILNNPWEYKDVQVIKALKIVNSSDERFSFGKALIGRLIDIILINDRDFLGVVKASLIKFQFQHISQESIAEILNLTSLLEESRNKWFNSVVYMNTIEEQGRQQYDSSYYTYDYSWPGHGDPDYGKAWRLQLEEAKEAERLNYEELTFIKNRLELFKNKIMGSEGGSSYSFSDKSSSPVTALVRLGENISKFKFDESASKTAGLILSEVEKIAAHYGISMEDAESERQARFEDQGGLYKGIFLKAVLNREGGVESRPNKLVRDKILAKLEQKNKVHESETLTGEKYHAVLLAKLKEEHGYLVNVINEGADKGKVKHELAAILEVLNAINMANSIVSMNDLRNVPIGLIGALEKSGQILSVKAGEVFDIGFGDYGNQLIEFATEHPFITTIGGITAIIILSKGLYYFWVEHIVSNNINFLKNTTGWEASYVAELLGDQGNKRAVEPLIERLQDNDNNVRKSVVLALGKLKDKRAVGPLIQRLADENRDVRQSTIWALGKLGVVEPLVEQLNNSDVHYSATMALAKLGDARAVNPLITLLTNKDYFVRRNVVQALGELGNKRAVEPLIERLIPREFPACEGGGESREMRPVAP